MENNTIDELKNRKVWMLWKKQERSGKIAKMPFSAAGKVSGTNETYRDTWVSYEAAAQAVKAQKADGVGFKIPTGMFFLDIDHLDLNDPMVNALVERFDSYTEYSVSGTGIHVYGLCDTSMEEIVVDKEGKQKLSDGYYMHHPSNGLELYIGELTNRFAAFTGNVIADKPFRDCTQDVRYALNQYMKKPAKVVENHLAYVQSWITAIKQDSSVLFTAIKDADAITNYMLEKGRLETLREELTIMAELPGILPLGTEYEIWQLKDAPMNRRIAFMPYDYAKEFRLTESRYDQTYTGSVDLDTCSLDKIFCKFNIERPADYHGHSLSTSDVIVTKGADGQSKAWYCDSFGFRPLKDFTPVRQETQGRRRTA